MKYEIFENILTNLKLVSQKSQKFYDLGLDISNIQDDFHKIINDILSSHYSEEGVEWIDWFMNERESLNGDIYEATDKNGKPICYDIKSLWILVEEIRLSPNFKDFELKKPMSDEERLELIKNLFK